MFVRADGYEPVTEFLFRNDMRAYVLEVNEWRGLVAGRWGGCDGTVWDLVKNLRAFVGVEDGEEYGFDHDERCRMSRGLARGLDSEDVAGSGLVTWSGEEEECGIYRQNSFTMSYAAPKYPSRYVDEVYLCTYSVRMIAGPRQLPAIFLSLAGR